MLRKFLVYVLLGLSLAAPALAADKVPVRVYSTASHQFVSLEAALEELSAQDVVFLGEIHNNPVCHQLELSVFQGLVAHGKTVTLGMEMFERDVQPVLDEYVGGDLPATDFLAQSRPWPNYETDYKPLIEFARTQHLSVLASNIPQVLVSSVARRGLEALQDLPIHLLRLFARHTTSPSDRYLELFTAAMAGHSGVHGQDDDSLMRFYVSQCLKDDTMAESVADYLDHVGPNHMVLHVNGSFHTDYGLGTAARTRARLPNAKVSVVSMIPVDDLDTVQAEEHSGQGDFLMFVPR